MSSITNPKGMQTPSASRTAGGENRQDARRRHYIEGIIWGIGLLLFIASCVIIHGHPQPYSFDLATTQFVQGLHVPSWLHTILVFPSLFNNPLPSIIAVGIWFFWMLLMAFIFHRRGKSPATWLQSAFFLLLATLGAQGLQGIAEVLVNRPRPDPHHYPIHVYTPLVPFPTYPSGHTDHDVVYYGFLLYLSFTRPVREWRYRWFLLPLQLYAVFDILSIGYSRILEGDHWLTDVFGGYLEGLVHLFLFIFLYRWCTNYLARRRAQKMSAVQMR